MLEKKDLHAIVFRMKRVLIYLNYFSQFNFTEEKMAMCSMVTLKDGSEVPQTTLTKVTDQLKKLKETDFGTLIDLFEKCKDKDYKFSTNLFQNSELQLKELSLMQDNGEINPDIQKIVLNSLEGRGLATKFIDPFSYV